MINWFNRNTRLRRLETQVTTLKATIEDKIIITKDQAAMVIDMALREKEGAEEMGRDHELNYPHNPGPAMDHYQYAEDLQELLDSIARQHT